MLALASTAVALSLAAPANAAASTYFVSPDGSDAAVGTSDAPFQTIGKGASMARRGDTVFVTSGRYPETVTLNGGARGVTFRGIGPAPPIVDGAQKREFGFQIHSADDVVIENFEVTGQTKIGINTDGSSNTITENLVHDVGSMAIATSTGIRVAKSANTLVADNTVHSIGPGGESMGIWLVQSTETEVADNTVYLVRKEGVRDWQGLRNTIRDNRLFLNFTGVSLNTSTGSLVVNNYVYDNTLGIVAKHLSYETVLSYWQLGTPEWSQIWHNTIWRSTGTSMNIGQSGEPLDYLDVRNNIFEDAGLAYVRDVPTLRGPNVIMDGNAYAHSSASGRPEFLYKDGWGDGDGISAWDAYRQQLGWEEHGLQLDPALTAPAEGNLDYLEDSPAAAGSLELPDSLGAQLGARGLPPATTMWTPYAMTAVDSSSADTWWTRTHLEGTADDNQLSYWLSSTNSDEYVTYDFGQARMFDYLVLTVFSHWDRRNIRGYRFEVSDDNISWRPALKGVNPDSAGSSYKYALPQPATARYLRFTMVDTFCKSYGPREECGPYFVFSDLKAGSLSGGSTPSTAPPPSPPTPPPSPPTLPPPASPQLAPFEPGSGDQATTQLPPQLSVSVPRQTVGDVVRKGSLLTRMRCSETCRVSSQLFSTPRSRKPGTPRSAEVTMARGSVALAAGSRKAVRLRLTQPARRRLARADAITLRLQAAATGEGSGSSMWTRAVKLGR